MSDHEPNHGYNKNVAANQSGLWGDDMPERPEWHAQARCGRNGILGDDATARVKVMFPTRGEDINRARSACEGCPVSEECRRDSLFLGSRFGRGFGVWAGITGRQRRDITPWATCVCGAEFERIKPGMAYCSEDCRRDARLKSNVEWRDRAS